MLSSEILEMRAKGAFSISIATSLALEGLLGLVEGKPTNEAPWKVYNDLVINIRTLYRNLLGSVEGGNNELLNPKDYAMTLIEEMRLIKGIVAQHTFGRVNVSFYVCTYKSLTGLYPFSFFREAKTSLQQFNAAQENVTIDHIYKFLDTENDLLVKCDTNILIAVKKSLMLTHYPIDLLHLRKATEVALLESHTGIIKKKHRWNTKLHDGKNLERIPFDKMTVQVFGDSAKLFKPYPKEIRDKLLALSSKYEWHGATTRDRVMQAVQLSKDPVLLVTIRKLYL